MNTEAFRVNLDSKALQYFEKALQDWPQDLTKCLSARGFDAKKFYCLVHPESDKEALNNFHSGWGVTYLENTELVLGFHLLKRSADMVRPILLITSPFSRDQRARYDFGFPTLMAGDYVYYYADMTVENEIHLGKLLGFAGFTLGTVGILTSAADSIANPCGNEISIPQLEKLVSAAVIVMVSIYDGANYLLCEL